MTKRITIRITADGSIVAEAGGHQGPRCLDDGDLIAALCNFATVVESRLTPEYAQGALLMTQQDGLHLDRDDS